MLLSAATTQAEYYSELLRLILITSGVTAASVLFLGLVVAVALYGRYLK